MVGNHLPSPPFSNFSDESANVALDFALNRECVILLLFFCRNEDGNEDGSLDERWQFLKTEA